MRLGLTALVTRRPRVSIAATMLVALLALSGAGPTIAVSADEVTPVDEAVAPGAGEGCFYVFLALLVGSGTNVPNTETKVLPSEALPLFAPLLDVCGIFDPASEWRICGVDRAWIDYANANSPNPWVTAPVGLGVDTLAGAERSAGDPDNAQARRLDKVLNCEDRRAHDAYDEFDGGTVAPLPTPPTVVPGPAPVAVTASPPDLPAPAVRSQVDVPARPAATPLGGHAVAERDAVVPPARPSEAELVSAAEPVLPGSMSVLDLAVASVLGIGAMYALNRRIFGRFTLAGGDQVEADDSAVAG